LEAMNSISFPKASFWKSLKHWLQLAFSPSSTSSFDWLKHNSKFEHLSSWFFSLSLLYIYIWNLKHRYFRCICFPTRVNFLIQKMLLGWLFYSTTMLERIGFSYFPPNSFFSFPAMLLITQHTVDAGYADASLLKLALSIPVPFFRTRRLPTD
jgi:hypothetical protein